MEKNIFYRKRSKYLFLAVFTQHLITNTQRDAHRLHHLNAMRSFWLMKFRGAIDYRPIYRLIFRLLVGAIIGVSQQRYHISDRPNIKLRQYEPLFPPAHDIVVENMLQCLYHS